MMIVCNWAFTAQGEWISSSPDVSVIVFSNEQGENIRRCLDGVMSQQCEFSFEVVVIDNSLSDATADVLQEYKAMYPNIFSFYRSTQRDDQCDIAERIDLNGRYLVLCDGDETWIKGNKMQEQYGFLESHNAYGGVFHSLPSVLEADFVQVIDFEPRNIEAYQLLLLPSVMVRLADMPLARHLLFYSRQRVALLSASLYEGRIKCFPHFAGECSPQSVRRAIYHHVISGKSRSYVIQS